MNFLKKFRLFDIISISVAVIIIGIFAYGIFGANSRSSSENQDVAGQSDGKKVRIYEFWGEGCPHCAKANKFLEANLENRPEIDWQKFEVYYNSENQKKYEEVAKALDMKPGGVPFIVVGDKVFEGYSEDQTGQEIMDRVDQCLSEICEDKVAEILGLPELTFEPNSKTKEEIILTDISFKEAKNILETNANNSNFQVLDIRTAEEVATGTITSDPINLDFYASDFQTQLEKLDKNQTYLMYCNSGNRSGQALKMMQNMGFQKVYNLESGIQDWITNGGQLD